MSEVPLGIHVVAVHGYADERIARELEAALFPLAASDSPTVVVDLEDAVGLDDKVLSVVASCASSTIRRGGRLAIITRSHNVRDLVDRSGLADIVSIHPSLREAVPRV